MQLAAAARTALILLLPALIIRSSAWRRLRRFESTFPVFVVFCVVSALWVLPSRRHPVARESHIAEWHPQFRIRRPRNPARDRVQLCVFRIGLAGGPALAVFLVVTRRGPVVRQRSQAAAARMPWRCSSFGRFTPRPSCSCCFEVATAAARSTSALRVPAITLLLLSTYRAQDGGQVPVVGSVAAAPSMRRTASQQPTTTCAYARARLTAATAITNGAVPRTAIAAGLEYEWIGAARGPRLRRRAAHHAASRRIPT